MCRTQLSEHVQPTGSVPSTVLGVTGEEVGMTVAKAIGLPYFKPPSPNPSSSEPWPHPPSYPFFRPRGSKLPLPSYLSCFTAETSTLPDGLCLGSPEP